VEIGVLFVASPHMAAVSGTTFSAQSISSVHPENKLSVPGVYLNLFKVDNPRGSNPTSPGNFPVRALGCSRKGTALDLALMAIDVFELEIGEKAATPEVIIFGKKF